MKVLKDADKVLQIMNRKLKEPRQGRGSGG